MVSAGEFVQASASWIDDRTMARIIWALLVKDGTYRTPAAAA